MTAAAEAAVARMFDRSPLERLRHGAAPVLRVPGRGIARVVRAEPGALEAARRTARAAEVLEAAGAPLVTPRSAPVAVEGLVVTLWADAPDDGARGPTFPTALGRALRRLHLVGAELLAEASVDLPPWDPAVALERRLAAAGAAAEGAVGGPLRTLLGRLLPLPDDVRTVLHTDAHAGNACVDRQGRVTLVDLDGLAVGPARYDLAAVDVTERRQGGGTPVVAAVLAGYDPSLHLGDPVLRRCAAVREVLAVAFAAGCGPVGLVEAGRRLEGLLAGRSDRWGPVSDPAVGCTDPQRPR